MSAAAKPTKVQGWIFAGRHKTGMDWEHAVCGIVTYQNGSEPPESCGYCGMNSRPYVEQDVTIDDDDFSFS